MARPSYSLGSKAGGGGQVKSLVVSALCGSALAAFTAATWKLRMPEKGQIVGVTLNVGQRGGTHSTSTVQVQNAGTSVLGAAFDVAALTPGTPVDKEGANLAAAAASVAKDAELRVIVAVSGGSSPTWADATVQIDYVPLGD
jgi:hypothetical protein